MKKVPYSQYGRGRLLLVLAIVVLASVALGATIAWRDYRHFVDAPLQLEEARTIDFARGSSFKEIVRQLRRERITRASPFYWRVLAHEQRVASRLQAGEYALAPGLTPRGLVDMLAAGKVVQHAFTIVDGWTFRQLRLALAAETGLAQTLPGLDDATIAIRLGIEDGRPEGWFLPETYAWVKGDADVVILQRAHRAMRSLLDAQWPGRDPAVPLKTP